jgi:hypothetical protein
LKLLPFLLSQSDDLSGINTIGDLLAEIIDADHMAGIKEASCLSQKETAFLIVSRLGKFSIEEEIN